MTLDSTDSVGEGTSLAVTGMDDPVIVYRDTSGNALNYATCDQSASTNGNCNQLSDWSFLGGLVPGAAFSPAVATRGNDPLVLYQTGGGQVSFLTCDASLSTNGDCDQAGDWSTPVAIDNGGVESAITVDPNGDLMASYSGGASNDDLRYAFCDVSTSTNGNCDQAGDWVKATVDSLGSVGRYSSIDTNSLGDPLISYYDATNGEIKAAICDISASTNGNCDQTANWITVFPAGFSLSQDRGQWTSLAVTAAGDPVVSYYYVTNTDLYFATCDVSASTNGNCDQAADWVTTAVEAGSATIGRYSSLELDPAGDILIAYEDTSDGFGNELNLAQCDVSASTNGNCDQTADWTTEVASDAGFTHSVGARVSLGVDSAGDALISHYDQTEFDLEFTTVAAPTTFTVNTTSDTDDGQCDLNHCSLREAITAANSTTLTDTIEFNIPGAGPHIIQPGSFLSVTQPAVIDATTEPDYAGTPVVELNGAMAGLTTGLSITAGGSSTLKGLSITGYTASLFGNDARALTIASNVMVQGNYIGVDSSGASKPNRHALIISGSNNLVGGTAAGQGNLIANNIGHAIEVNGAGATGNIIRGNSIHSNSGKAIENINGGNTELTPPTITSVGSASGTSTCLGCTVDIYSDAADEGKTYHGSTTTDGLTGTWTYSGPVSGPNVTATVTDASGNTSEFSSPVACPDDDSDGLCNSSDNCPTVSNSGQEDGDADGVGNACDSCPGDPGNDADSDGVCAGGGYTAPKTGDNDNCPTTANPGQQNLDGDALGDACDPDDDNDLVNDTVETACGSDPMDITPPLSRPERIDGTFAGVDDDGDTQIDESLPSGAEAYDCDGDGHTGAAEAGTPLCGNGVNDDGVIFGGSDDGVVDDGCPGGPAQAGAYSEAQFNIGLGDQDPCGTNGWPLDFVSGQVPDSTNRITLADLTSFLAPVRYLDKSPGHPDFNSRWDLVPGATIAGSPWIQLTDLTALLAGPVAYPPMLGGARAFGGPPCPWPG